jgi:two-component system NtrC family sensor kinase
MHLSLKSKIWFTVLSIVLMFAFFILIYFPNQQEKTLLKNFNTEVQNLASTVALGVKIALTEQNFEGVETALDFVKKNHNLVYVSLVQVDTISDQNGHKTIKKSVFKTFPDKHPVNVDEQSNDTLVVKSASFVTSMMNGEIHLALSTDEISASKEQIKNTSIIVCCIVFAIGILIGFFLARNISVPVLALRDAALKVGQGDRSQQVASKGKDEIGELGQAFNKMVRDLALAESERKAAQDQLIQSEKMASLGQMTAGIAHEIKNPLNFVNNFSKLSLELMKEMEEETDENEKKEILESIKSNLAKINHHGKRADSIVATMLQHSRGAVGTKIPYNLNQLCEEFTDLAYHGMRATVQNFNSAIVKNWGEGLSEVPLIPQEYSRVILNLLNNAFYAVNERVSKEAEAGISGESPEVSISTSLENGMAVVRIKDNGGGIPEAIKNKIFEPFFTTKPTGKGTGLGLSLSYDIISKEHKGKMSVSSEPGKFTLFTIEIPT